MTHAVQLPETDLLIPTPGDGESWDPHTLHTHYFGITVPEAQIGAFIYIRYVPAFRSCQGGVIIYQGMNNLTPVDAAYHDYQIAMPWPSVEGTRITTENGLHLDFVEPGRRTLITYRSADGATSLDLDVTAVTPLCARGHVIPGEELHASQESGGSEQFVRSVGELVVHGERHAVDCVTARDRSWRQIRQESRNANLHPPVSWTPIYFDGGLTFNQVGIESPDTDPAWAGLYDIPIGAPTHHYGWVMVDGDIRSLTQVRRAVHRVDPVLFAPLSMTIDATDTAGSTYRFHGEATALSPIVSWPNIAAFDSVFAWRDEEGREAHGSVQTMHVEAYASHLKSSRAGWLADLRNKP